MAKKDKRKQEKSKNVKVKLGIKKKLLSVIIPCFTLGMLALCIMLFVNSQSIIIKKANGFLQAEGNNYRNQIQTTVNEILGELEVIHGTIETMNPDDTGMKNYIKYTTEVNPMFSGGVYMADAKGGFIHATYVPEEGYIPTDRDWYKEGVNNDTMKFGQPYLDVNTNTFCVTASCNLKNRATDKAVLAVDVYLADISEAINGYHIMNTGYSFLVNNSESENKILAHPQADYINMDLTEIDANTVESKTMSLVENADGEVHTVSVGGENYMLVANKLDNCDWVLVSSVKEADVLKELHSLRTFAAALLIVILAVMVVLITLLINSTVKPIRRLTNNISQITEGDFTVEVVTKGKDEVALMSTGLQKFVENMREVIRDIDRMSSTLEDQAESSTNTSSTLYRSSETQAQSMKELNDTVEELATSVVEVASNANNLAEIVSKTGEKGSVVSNKMAETAVITEKGHSDMEEIKIAMANIESSISQLETAVSKVGNSTQEITKFVGIIGEIASQTNLLSLNASIEAARAGEAGKGFAVVAGEIQKLADTSADAVSKISSLTDMINELVEETVQQTHSSVASIGESSNMVAEACDTFSTIVETISETTKIVDEMVNEVKSVDEVANSVASITQEQSASTEEILATSEDLAESARSVTNDSQTVAQGAENISETADALAKHVKGFQY